MDPAHLSVDFADPHDRSNLNRDLVNLRSQLLELDVHSVSMSRDGNPPKDSKAGLGADLPGLLIVTIPSSGILGAIVTIVKARILAGIAREATLTLNGSSLVLRGHSETAEAELVQLWLSKAADDSA